MKDFESMTVKELREESRERGLTLEYKGHKFKKLELIERLVKYEEEKLENETCNKSEENELKENNIAVENKERLPFAHTLKEIVEKYSNRKEQWVYDTQLQINSSIACIHCVEAKDQNIYKKLRIAKVVLIDREKEFVTVETLFGTKFNVNFNEILYVIRPEDRFYRFPKDIRVYVKNHRTKKGIEEIGKRFKNQGQC